MSFDRAQRKSERERSNARVLGVRWEHAHFALNLLEVERRLLVARVLDLEDGDRVAHFLDEVDERAVRASSRRRDEEVAGPVARREGDGRERRGDPGGNIKDPEDVAAKVGGEQVFARRVNVAVGHSISLSRSVTALDQTPQQKSERRTYTPWTCGASWRSLLGPVPLNACVCSEPATNLPSASSSTVDTLPPE